MIDDIFLLLVWLALVFGCLTVGGIFADLLGRWRR
jgi:hypothetical protein